MMAFLARLFPSRSSYVSPEWLDALANRGSTEGWTEAPRIDWERFDYQGPRKDPKLPLWPYFSEDEVAQMLDCLEPGKVVHRNVPKPTTLPPERRP